MQKAFDRFRFLDKTSQHPVDPSPLAGPVERRVERYSEDEYLVTHAVGPGEDGMRLDRFLRMKYRKRSRSMIQDAIDRGVVQVTRKQGPHVSFGKMKASAQLLNGDEVLVVSERKPEPPVDFNYRIIFEDDDLFVIDKPGNLPVHPAGRYFFNTLLVHLRTQGHKDPLKAEREYFLVHRIDRETSGILVLTKTREAAAVLTKQFADRLTEKHYLAVVRGTTPEEFEVAAAMRRSKTSRVELKMEVCADDAEDALSALTRFRRIATAGGFSLVECFPKTGRQHQIRVHLDHLGHPIVGDKLYGMTEADAYRYFESKFLSPEAQARLLLPRHALHAAGIRFRHPITGLWLEYTSPLPSDLQGFFHQQSASGLTQANALQAPAPLATVTPCAPSAAFSNQ
jgi:23S rRNA pseudouridine1911/1915/1917 synthase